MTSAFKISDIRPIRDGLTVSMDSKLGKNTKVTYFSLGKDTSISQESYDHVILYIGDKGNGSLLIGEECKEINLTSNSIIIVPDKTLCGMNASDGMVYTEVILEGKTEKEIIMNSALKTNEVFQLKDLISYEEGSISNMDVVSTGNMKYVLMAFDKGTGLTPHRAPGNAIVFALEGKATIGYEGADYEITEGQCFRFEKNGLHSVTANEKFKMALLLVIE